MPDPKYKEAIDLINDLRLAIGNPIKRNWGGAVFWIGAGCSRSAGIPLASEIAQDSIKELVHKYGGPKFRNADKALKWLRDKKPGAERWSLDRLSWGELYGEIFQEEFVAPQDQHRIILNAIKKSRDKINWAHLCLGELVKRGYIHTVLTTNFDQLVLRGIINTGLLPVVADGLDSSTRITGQPETPQIVHLHGSMHTYNLVNSKKAMKRAGNAVLLPGMMQELLRESRMLVVIGYAGGEEGVMKQLIKAVKSNAFKDTIIYWVMYENEHSLLSKGARQLLAVGNNKYVIPNRGAEKLFADKLFIDIMEGLKIGAPEWMQQPTRHMLKESERFATTQDELIQENIRRYQQKVQRLDILWAKEEEAKKLVDEIPNLRLEGKYDEALRILRKQISEGNSTYEIWRMRSEIAYEAAQSSSNQRLSEKSLKESTKAWRQILQIEQNQKNISVRCEANVGLGNALVLLYDLDRKEEHLEEAVSVYRKALEENAWESKQTNWAEAQNNLGSALQTLGDLKYKNHLGEAVIAYEEAVIAYKRALKVYTRKSAPRLWAATQDHLGGALLDLGSIKKDIKLLNKAIAAYKGALGFYQEADDSDQFGKVKKNLQQVQTLINKLKIKSKG